jgi:hypothetical protein
MPVKKVGERKFRIFSETKRKLLPKVYSSEEEAKKVSGLREMFKHLKATGQLKKRA